MRIRSGCNPDGPGLRGMLTANIIQPGTVHRGAVARVSISAAPGTHFTTLRWAGTGRRSDCRYALQVWAKGPGVPTVPIKNVRANHHCPPPLRAQAAGYHSRLFTVPGATRIVQRIICTGAPGHPQCTCCRRMSTRGRPRSRHATPSKRRSSTLTRCGWISPSRHRWTCPGITQTRHHGPIPPRLRTWPHDRRPHPIHRR